MPAAVRLLIALLALPAALPAQRATEADLATFAYDSTQPLDPHLTPMGGRPGRIAVTLASPRGGRASGILVVPAGAGPFPAIVLLHGSGGNAAQMLGRAEALAAQGFVAYAIDAPSARRDGPWINLTLQDSVEQVQLMVDLRRAVDFLRTRPEVDPARLAFNGISYGGAMGVLFAGLERRVRAFVLTVADGGLVAHLTGADDHLGPLDRLSAQDRARWLRAMQPIEPSRFIHFAPGAALLFQSGRADVLVPPADAEALHAAAPAGRTVRWYESGHRLPAEATDDMVAWLRQRLR